MKIALVTPARPGARNGNRHTALRWAAFLRAAGHRVVVSTDRFWPKAELLLALHARRSHPAIAQFAAEHPERPLVLALTGTDVYRDIHESAQARESLRMASRFIVLQPMAALELAPKLRRKVSVVVQSCASRLSHRPVASRFRLCVIGNLRDEKDPLRALAALRRVPENRAIELIQIGADLDRRLAEEARAGMRRDSRYRWLGSLPHARTLKWLASSHALVISSRMEGGANVVCEALRIGVPVIASRISGNIGLLGRDYPAYFPPGDDIALARLIARVSSDQERYSTLKRRIRSMRAKVAPQSEARALLAAVRASSR